jgi:hypothetical protein
MKKTFIKIIAFLIINEVIDRLDSNEFREDFESYGTEINRDIWSTWDGNSNPIELGYDPKEGVRKKCGLIRYNAAAALAQQTDALLNLGNKTTGKWGLTFDMYIPANKTAYMNLQGRVPLDLKAPEWLVGNIFFGNGNGSEKGLIDNTSLGRIDFDYPDDQWFKMEMNFDISQGIDNATWQFNIDGVQVIPAGTILPHRAGYTSLGGVDFFGGYENIEYYVDNFCYKQI